MEVAQSSLKVDTSLKGIILLTLPISMAKLIPELNYLFNAAFLGHMGSRELALAGITGVYYLVFSAVGYGLNNALLSIMSRRAGEDNRNEIFSSLWHGVVLGWLLAAIFTLFTWLSVRPLMTWAGVEPEGASMASGFLDIRMLGLFFLFTLQMQNAFLISVQQTRYLILIAVVQSVVNVTLDYGLIFGNLGFTAMGFNGAAVASVISELVGMMTVFLVIKNLKIKERFNIQSVYTLYMSKLKLVLKQGFPLMSQLAISTGAWWLFFVLVSRNYTYEDQAISQTMRNLFGLGGVFSWAFGSSANTILSNLIGQGRQEEIFGIIRRLVLISMIGMSVLMAIINIYPSLFLGLFGQPEAFIEQGLPTLRIVSAAMIIVCAGVIWLNAVVATGRTTVVFWIEFWGIAGYLAYVWVVIEVMKLSLEAAWMSEWIYWITMLVLSYLYLRFGNWRQHLAFEDDAK